MGGKEETWAGGLWNLRSDGEAVWYCGRNSSFKMISNGIALPYILIHLGLVLLE